MDLQPDTTKGIIATLIAMLATMLGIVWKTKPTRSEMILANAKTAEIALAASARTAEVTMAANAKTAEVALAASAKTAEVALAASARTAEVALTANDRLREEFDSKITGAIAAVVAADAVTDHLQNEAVRTEIAGLHDVVNIIHDDVK